MTGLSNTREFDEQEVESHFCVKVPEMTNAEKARKGAGGRSGEGGASDRQDVRHGRRKPSATAASGVLRERPRGGAAKPQVAPAPRGGRNKRVKPSVAPSVASVAAMAAAFPESGCADGVFDKRPQKSVNFSALPQSAPAPRGGRNKRMKPSAAAVAAAAPSVASVAAMAAAFPESGCADGVFDKRPQKSVNFSALPQSAPALRDAREAGRIPWVGAGAAAEADAGEALRQPTPSATQLTGEGSTLFMLGKSFEPGCCGIYTSVLEIMCFHRSVVYTCHSGVWVVSC